MDQETLLIALHHFVNGSDIVAIHSKNKVVNTLATSMQGHYYNTHQWWFSGQPCILHYNLVKRSIAWLTDGWPVASQ